ncbi:unnamed protein product [Ceutorhynchus assimilis]|uniref:Major facilitator superfamily (MFS) profile domain-containing protein n=1 Tax=Ceutorhynchus assimilis TaxID=467358 RepID=A0A9N9QMJ9_9CUCU|nr:unnamed protein product [Ceutorhynchus assimilis]
MESEIDFIDSRKASAAFKRTSKQFTHVPATFEEAITATEFGKYNVMLAILVMLASFGAVLDTSTMSYTFVAAQCDLELSLSDKGLLNAVTYAGMITSAMLWGFLFDVLGRKQLLILGFLVDAVFVFTSAFSQSLLLLLITKYLQGLIINGPFAALSSYISEFHCAKYRPIFQMIIGTSISLGQVLLPCLAWLVLPQPLDFTLINLNFHSWSVFLLITGLPAFLSGIVFTFCPESPKFLMTCGENEKALEIFRKVYSVNTGNPPESYPIKSLLDETKVSMDGSHVTAHRSKGQALREGFQQIKPIFFKPHLSKISLTCAMMLFIVMSQNMLRLWLPQIFQIITDYQLVHEESANLCTMLESGTLKPSNATLAEECVVNNNNSKVYINSIIVGCTAMIGNALAGTLIRFIGKKKILLAALTTAGIFSVSMYFASSEELAVAFSSIFIACGSVANNVMVSVTVDLFPTTLRTMAIAVGMMIGRTGAMAGNFVFPYLLASGCEPPFFVVGAFMIAAALVSLLIPNTDMKALT